MDHAVEGGAPLIVQPGFPDRGVLSNRSEVSMAISFSPRGGLRTERGRRGGMLLDLRPAEPCALTTDESVEERISFDGGSPWLPEHRARYVFALPHVQGRASVLDLACGAGVGADLLAAPGRLVLGTDLSSRAVAMAAERAVGGYEVFRSDGTKLPLRDHSIEAVVSFETVEHVGDDVSFVRELRRVLVPDGVVVMSTPNALVTRPVEGVPRNPFHVREYLAEEFEQLLRTTFSDVTIFGQRTSDAYGPCPYWEGAGGCRQSFSYRLTSLFWKLVARLPPSTASWASRMLLRRSLYPGVDDFSFVQGDLARAHVLVAVCRP